MLSQILNALQTILIPLVIGGLIVGGCAVYFVGRPRKSDRPPPGPAPRRPAPPQSRPVDLGPDTEPALAEPLPAPAPTSPPAPSPITLTADLLLVDDSAVVRAKLRRLFEPAGYQVALARDGREALQLLEQGRYALMVTDLEMPHLDGVGLIRAVQGRVETADMPIMAITGHDDLQARLDECREICGIYRKPWIDDDLLSHVQMLVRHRDPPGADRPQH